MARGCARLAGMGDKATLHRYLALRRDDLLAKLDGLDDLAVRRPMTPTGTNLLGLVKHVAYVQLGYFGEVFGRPSGRPYPWDAEGAQEGVDLWAAPDESREDRKSTRLNSSHANISYAVFCLKKKNKSEPSPLGRSLPLIPEEGGRVRPPLLAPNVR